MAKIHDFSDSGEKLKITYRDDTIEQTYEWEIDHNLTAATDAALTSLMNAELIQSKATPNAQDFNDYFRFTVVAVPDGEGGMLEVKSVAKGKDVSITINGDSSNNVLTKLFGFDRCESKTKFGVGGDAQTEDSYKKEQMKIVSDPFLLNDRTTILINSDIDMESDGPLVSSEFGDVTVSYSYNWDITNNKPLSQSGALGSKYLVISCVPTYLSRDKRENVNILNDEFYGISPNGDTNISFGYVSYQSLGSKKSVEDNIKENNSPSGYLFPKTTDGEDNSVFAGNWFEHWVTSYGDLADAMQGKSSGGSGNFASKFSETNQSLAYSKLVNQTAVVNTNFLKKLLYIKKNTYLKEDIDSVNIYITVLEDWTTPANALDSFGATGIVNGAAYIPYLDVNASRQIVSPDYDIWNNGETTNPAGTKSPSTNYVVDESGETRSNHYTMVPHQKLDVISDFPKWGQENILSDSSYETNKDMLLFDWRAKTLAQPTFACCELDLMVKLGEESDSVRLDKFAGSYISNEFTYKKTESDYILDANEENIYKYHETINAEGKSYVADKGTYVHGYSEIFEEQFPSKNQEEKLFIKFDPNKQVFKNDTVVPKEENIKMITSREKKIPWFTWEGLSLPMGTQTVAPPGSLRCILTKEAITALVSIIRTASLLITGMVMNHELAFSSGKVIDTITNKTLYIAWYNTNEFLRQLSDLPISNILNPVITSDFATDTIKMPNWLDVFKQADNIKIAQFFRSSLCKKKELERMIGPIDKLITSDASKNYPPPAGFRTDKTETKTGVMNLPESYNKELHYYKVPYTDRNKITYPSQTGTTMAEDMFSFQTTTANVGEKNPLRGLLRPIMWDPSGSYPNHGLIPHASRGEKLGYEWGKLAYISCDGTLRNNGNCLQKTALNYVDETVGIDGTPDIKELTARLMYCTPYIPVGQIKINVPEIDSDIFTTADLYRHQDISGDMLIESNQLTTQGKRFNLKHVSSTGLEGTLYVNAATVEDKKIGPPVFGAADSGTATTRKFVEDRHIPKGIGYNNGENADGVKDTDKIKIDLARGRRRLSLHTITSGIDGKGLYTQNNNMGIGPLAYSCMQDKLVETGDGYFPDSLSEKNSDANKDFYVTDSLYRTQTVISLLLSGYGLYSDKVYDQSEQTAVHPKIYGNFSPAGSGRPKNTFTKSAQRDVSRNELYEFQNNRKRYLSGPDKNKSCLNVDLLNLRLNNGDEITPKNSAESAYRWIGPSSHFLMEPNTEDIWRYIKDDKPGVPGDNRTSVIGRNQYESRSESFASGGAGLKTGTKTYLHNGIADGTDSSGGDSNYWSAIGSAYEKNDFNENRPSLFALSRGYDISRNLETVLLECTALTTDNINFSFGVKEDDNENLIYCDAVGAELDGNIKALVERNKPDIQRFQIALTEVVDKLCKIKPVSERASIHLTDHHFMTLASDEALTSSKNKPPTYNSSEYLRLQSDMVDYTKNSMSLVDFTGLFDAQNEIKTGGSFVEGMYYIDELSSNTIRIFYPTPLREDFVRPVPSSAMITVAGFVADTCKGAHYKSKITGLGKHMTKEQEPDKFDVTADGSFNQVIKASNYQNISSSSTGRVQNFIFGRGGIVTKKRNSILEILENLPGWSDGTQPLKDTSGGDLLKDFIKDSYTYSTGSNTQEVRTGLPPHFKGDRLFAINTELNRDMGKGQTVREIDALRYSNMSVLTITGVRDFAFSKPGDSDNDFDAPRTVINDKSDGGTESYTQKRIFSRIGSIMFPGATKKTKYVIANHESDRETLSKSILSNREMGNIDDSESRNYAIRGQVFKLKWDTHLSTYYLQATKVPGFIASSWNTIQGCICAPSMGSAETNEWEPETHPGQKFRTNFGVVFKTKTDGVPGAKIGISSVSDLDPVEFTVDLYTIKSAADTVSENIGEDMAPINPSQMYDANFNNTVQSVFSINLMLRSVEFSETEIMNYYNLNTIIFLSDGSNINGKTKQVNKFIKNMPENLTQYLGYVNRTVTAFMEDNLQIWPLGTDEDIKEARRFNQYWIDNSGSNLNQEYAPGIKDVDGETMEASFNTEYSASQLYFEINLINIKSMQDIFDKQLMAWNEGIVGAKIGDMKLEDFDNISAEQVVDSSETLTEIPGFHILMWVEKRSGSGTNETKEIITPESIDPLYKIELSSGKNGSYRGLYDDIKFSLYEQNLLVKKGALSIQNEQVITNRNPIVQAISSRGSIIPSMKYEYGVYKENMWLSMYKNSMASQINIPVINELPTVTHPDSIGLNTSHCENREIGKSMGVLVFQHANVLYENHNGINFSIPSSLKKINSTLTKKLVAGEKLVFCMCAVAENNIQVNNKSGVNPSNSALLNIVITEKNIANVKESQWSLCYEEILIDSVVEGVNTNAKSEFENSQFSTKEGVQKIQYVDRDIQFNMLIDLFRSKNTTKIQPIMAFNKLPRIEQVKYALQKNCLPNYVPAVAAVAAVTPVAAVSAVINVTISGGAKISDKIKITVGDAFFEYTVIADYTEQDIGTLATAFALAWNASTDAKVSNYTAAAVAAVISITQDEANGEILEPIFGNTDQNGADSDLMAAAQLQITGVTEVLEAPLVTARVESMATPHYPAAKYAPFLSAKGDYSKNFAIISRFKYHVDSSGEPSSSSIFDAGGAGFYEGAGKVNADKDRETLMDLFYAESHTDASTNMYTITKLEASRKLKPGEMNGANAYTGGDFNDVSLNVPFYSNTYVDDKKDVSGNILHHYKKLSTKKTGVSGVWVETLIYFTSLLTRPLLNGEDSITNAFWKIRDNRAGEWVNKPKELFDESQDYKEEMRTYRKCLVSTLIHSMSSTSGGFITDILNRRPPATWKEEGKVYNAFPQLEFCATFRNQLMDKSYMSEDKPLTREAIGNLAKFPLYCYIDDNNQNIVFPSWKEEGILVDGQKTMVYEEKINYKFAVDYFGDEFINDILDPVFGFGFNSTTPLRRVQEFENRLKKGYNLYVEPLLQEVTTGSRSVFSGIFSEKGTLQKYTEDLPRKLNGDSGYLKKLGLIQMWSPFLEVLFHLKTKKSDATTTITSKGTYIQPDIIMGSHVNTFKNKFDIQNFQLKLNTVRLDINLLKECTAFEIKEVEFCDNTLLTLDTLNPVGNAQTLFLPIMIKTKAEKVETVKSRKIELKTDYLLETFNKMDVMSLMNNIWYRIDEMGNRIVLSPTELARVPLFRNNPGIMFDNSYEPILKHKLDKDTTLDEMVIQSLRHVDGGKVRGLKEMHDNDLKLDRDWSGMGWCLNGIGKRLGFTGGKLNTYWENRQKGVVTGGYTSGDLKQDDIPEGQDWAVDEFGLLANKEKGYDASGGYFSNETSSDFTTSENSRGALASSLFGAHRQKLNTTQNTGGFVRSAWLAERLSSIVFGVQNFPSFEKTLGHAVSVPFNSMGSGMGGKVTAKWSKEHYKKSNSLLTIISDENYGRLKLAGVRQDDSARGQLRDYRYPGKQFDKESNVPIFAESVPNTNGTFACQIIRMIKSGLVGRPEDDKILISDQDVINQINGGVYMAFTTVGSNITHNVNESLTTHLPDNFTNDEGVVDTNAAETFAYSNFKNVVMNPSQYMYLKLQEKISADSTNPYKGGYVPMQYVLQQLLSNDPQRFLLNEEEAKRHSVFTQKSTKHYNKVYKQWRVRELDNELPNEHYNVKEADVPILLKYGKLQILDKVSIDPNISKDEEPASAHPLSLCIRGLDLDHCVMTHYDLSNNTLTPIAVDPSGEFLKGRSSSQPVQNYDANNVPIYNDAFAAGHERYRTKDISNGKIDKYGPALYLTEGNAPRRNDSDTIARHEALNVPIGSDLGGNLTDFSSKWQEKEDMLDGGKIVNWNSYIEHTDLTKTYPIYMLPLMDTDTISIIVTNDGSLKDPLEGTSAEKSFTKALASITEEIQKIKSFEGVTDTSNVLNINNTAGTGNVEGSSISNLDGILPDTIEDTVFDDYPSITGHGINPVTGAPSISRGLYYDCVNLLVAPELGPYEKGKIEEYQNQANPNATIDHNGVSINVANWSNTANTKNIFDLSSGEVFGSDGGGGWGARNSLEAYYLFLGMDNYIEPGGDSGGRIRYDLNHAITVGERLGKTRAGYLAYDLSNVTLENYYQKFVTRSFTVKYKLQDENDYHIDYNDIRISQLSTDQVSAFELKDDFDLPKKDIFNTNSKIRFEYDNYDFFWDPKLKSNDGEKNDVDQMVTAKPILVNSTFTEISKAAGSVLIPRRFDGRPMDANIESQNVICIRQDNISILNKQNGKKTDGPSQSELNGIKFSLDLGIPMQGGGLIRCKIPIEAADENSHAFFLDPEYNRDYLVFKVRDWVGNSLPTAGANYTTIKKQNILDNLHDAINRSQMAQLNEKLLQPYISAVATKYQPPPNTSYRMPVLLPSKPGGANIKVDGKAQPRTFFQPLNLIINPLSGATNQFEIKPINESYYIRISANNTNWTNYMAQARNSIKRPVVDLSVNPINTSGGQLDPSANGVFPSLNAGCIVRDASGAMGLVKNTHLNTINVSYKESSGNNNAKDLVVRAVTTTEKSTNKGGIRIGTLNDVTSDLSANITFDVGIERKDLGDGTDLSLCFVAADTSRTYASIYERDDVANGDVLDASGTARVLQVQMMSTTAFGGSSKLCFYVPQDNVLAGGDVSNNLDAFLTMTPSRTMDSTFKVTNNLAFGPAGTLVNSSAHPQFQTMNGGNGGQDLSAVIHNVSQDQLFGIGADASWNVCGTKAPITSIYSLDLLALLNTTYSEDGWTHRTAPHSEKRVAIGDVVNADAAVGDFLSELKLASANRKGDAQPLLVISDIGKRWVDYEGQMMSRERFFRLCDILGDPSDNYALAMDNLGDTNKYFGDLDLGDEKMGGFYGKYFLHQAAKWDISGLELVDNSGVLLSGTADDKITNSSNNRLSGNYNKIKYLNNPIQHLHYGGYTTLDDPTTGAGCVGVPLKDTLKDSVAGITGGNHRKQFRLGHSKPSDKVVRHLRLLTLDGTNKYDTNDSSNNSVWFPSYAPLVSTQLYTNSADISNIDISRVNHPSKYVFTITGDDTAASTTYYEGTWEGGDGNGATADNFDYNVGLDKYTMNYIDYKYYGKFDHTSSTLLLNNNKCQYWEDIYGKTPYLLGDGYIDNSRYRTSGSQYKINGSGKVASSSQSTLRDDKVLSSNTFKLATEATSTTRGAWMSGSNQANYWNVIEFFSTRANTRSSVSVSRKNESRQAKSETKSVVVEQDTNSWLLE